MGGHPNIRGSNAPRYGRRSDDDPRYDVKTSNHTLRLSIPSVLAENR